MLGLGHGLRPAVRESKGTRQVGLVLASGPFGKGKCVRPWEGAGSPHPQAREQSRAELGPFIPSPASGSVLVLAASSPVASPRAQQACSRGQG